MLWTMNDGNGNDNGKETESLKRLWGNRTGTGRHNLLRPVPLCDAALALEANDLVPVHLLSRTAARRDNRAGADHFDPKPWRGLWFVAPARQHPRAPVTIIRIAGR